MKIERKYLQPILRTMTVSVFASLPTAWPEYLQECGGDGIVVAKINPNANHLFNDDDVIARGLIFMPDDDAEESHLRRLTIREKDLDIDSDYVAKAINRLSSEDAFNTWLADRDVVSDRIHATYTALAALVAAPVVDLNDMWRALRR